jgi:hypothetical protein
MGLKLALAVKLLRLAKGERIPASQLDYPLVSELIAEGIIADHRSGRTKSTLYILSPASLKAFLQNRFAIADLAAYAELMNQQVPSRAEMARTAANSKAINVRVFKGFLVNSYQPILATLNDVKITICPPNGTFQFIHSYERFIPDPDVLIINVENSENFSQIAKQQHHFSHLKPLFVSRYPQNQSKDLLKWLISIPNPYMHFGDYDFAGIGIYLNEYKRILGDRASFFIPPDLEELISQYGNRKLYDRQNANFKMDKIEGAEILYLINLLHKFKKGLEQEALISF